PTPPLPPIPPLLYVSRCASPPSRRCRRAFLISPPVFFSILPRPPISPLFPYTTLFRSHHGRNAMQRVLGLRLLVHTLHRRPSTRSEEHTSELQSLTNLVCRLLLEKKKVDFGSCDDWKKCYCAACLPGLSDVLTSSELVQ